MNQLRALVLRKTHRTHQIVPILSSFTQQKRHFGGRGNKTSILSGLIGIGSLGGVLLLYQYLEQQDYANSNKSDSLFSTAITKLKDLRNDATTNIKNISSSEKSAANLSDEEDPSKSYPVFVNDDKVEFPHHVPYLIIGAGTAGISAAKAIRASDSTAKVLLIGGDISTGEGASVLISTNDNSTKVLKEPPPYMRTPLSKEIWRRSEERRRKLLSPEGHMREHSWLFYEPDSFYVDPENLNLLNYGAIGLHSGDPVIDLNPDLRVATLKSGREITYDYCLIATGSKPRELKTAEKCCKTNKNLLELGKISYFRTLYDFKKLETLAQEYCLNEGRILIVGGGLLGCELATSLTAYGEKNNKMPGNLKVSHMFRESAPMGHILPPSLAGFTGRFEETKKVELTPSSDLVSVELIPGDAEINAGKLLVRYRQSLGSGKSNLEEIVVDHILCAIGVEPRTNLAEGASLELDRVHGGFLVNAEMESRAGIYVAGDAASYWDPVLACRRRVEHQNFAEETGALAGKNMAAAKLALSCPDSYRNMRGSSKYSFQSSMWSNMGKEVVWDAVGHIDSHNLETYAYFASPEQDLKAQSTEIQIRSCDEGNLGPGVVFYLTPREKRLVGILIWNLPEDIYEDDEQIAPSRLNLARSLLAKRMLFKRETLESDLKSVARDFDLYGLVNKDYQELKALMKSIKEEIEPSLEKKEVVTGIKATHNPPLSLKSTNNPSPINSKNPA